MSRPSKIAIVKELGSRRPRCLAAHAVRGQDEPELVVVERYPAAIGEEALVRLEEDTKSLIALDHTNVATLIWSVRLKGDVAVLSEWVDGESLESALVSSSKPSLDALLRVVVDACEGISALHAIENGKFVCGALGPDDVFLGVDGVTRITRFNLGRMPPEALGENRRASMAPEFLRGERNPTTIGRADVFALGTLLAACVGADRDALADVIARATAEDPAARYATPKELSQAIAAASKVASRAVVSQYVAKTFGAQIEARLAKLEPKVGISFSMTPPPMSAAPPAIEQPPVEPPKIAPPPVIAEPKPEPKIEPKKVEPKKVEPKPEAKSEPRLPQVEAKKKEPEKKEPAKTPAAVVAKKAVPLPAMTKKTNGTLPNRDVRPSADPSTPAKSAVAPTPKPKEKEVVPPPIEVPITISEPPPSAEELSEMDVDISSVRPPPIIHEPTIDIDDAVSPKAVSVVPPPTLPAPKSDRPPKSVKPPKKNVLEIVDTSVRPAHQRAAEAPKKGTSPMLLLLGAIVIGGIGFAAGRMTADVPLPGATATVTPTASSTATATTTGTTTATSTSTSTSTATSTASGTSTNTSSSTSTSASATASTSTSRHVPYSTFPSTAPSASGRYSPGAI